MHNKVTRLLACAFALSSLQADAAVSFTGLGFLTRHDNLETFYYELGDLSSDGSVIVGTSNLEDIGLSGGFQPGPLGWRWTASTGMTSIGLIPRDPEWDSYYSWSSAAGVSGDGVTIVGWAETYELGSRAIRWTAGTGIQSIANYRNRATGISTDGATVIGYEHSANGRLAFLTGLNGGRIFLGDLPGGTLETYPYDVSGDGSVIVGYGYGASGSEAFRWTAADGMVGLGVLPGDSYSSASAVSSDGTTIVGYSHGVSGREAFVWNSANGMVGLGDLPGGSFQSAASGVSGDGSTVVGRSSSVAAPSGEAIIWDGINGMRSVHALATQAGIDLTGWELTSAGRISDDGRVIVGHGNFQGRGQLWRLDLGAPVPEPATLTLAALLTAAAIATQRRSTC